MATSLESLLAERDWLLADGAMGTSIFAMGLESDEVPELWNETAPEKIRALYDGAISAGSDIFLTNSFGGNASRLKLHDAGDRVFALNRTAAEIARSAADAAGRPVVVAGSMGPTGEIMAPLGPLSLEAAADLFEAQARGLLAGGADVLWVETVSAPAEFRAASMGIARTGAPWCGTMSFDTGGRTMTGLTAVDMVALVDGLDHKPLAFGANCGVGASDLLRTVVGFGAAHPQLPVIAKGNAGVPKFADGHIHYDGTPELMADYAVLARDCGARIIGGCCGTTPAHLVAMRAALEATGRGPVPDLDTIAARLGAFSSTSDGAPPLRERRRGAAMIRAAVLALSLGLALPALAGDGVAVPGFGFTDGSGEVRDQREQHAAQLALFNETLRAELTEGGLDVLVPQCEGACAADTSGFKAMAAATRAVDANLLLVGGLHKISTLIGTIRVSLIDLDADKVICIRSLSYRGDNAEAWTRAAEFTAADVLKACFAGASS